jgi:CheY-like chemotaxis protein
LNSYTGTNGTIQKGALETPAGTESAVAGQTMIGERRFGERTSSERTIDEKTIGEALTGAAFAETVVWGGPETILLVEDESFVRKVTAEVLESAGYRLVITKSAAEAAEACRRCSRPVDLLLADVVMPGMSGRELAAQFESWYPRARVLLMSGYAEQLALCEQSPYGKTYLAKPFSSQMLLSRVRQLLDTNPFDCGAPA